MEYGAVKDLKMLVWLTQLGLSTAIPMAGLVLLSIWLKQRFQLGAWVIFAGCAAGLVCAIDGFRNSMKAMEALEKKKDGKKPVSYNDHD